MLVPRSSARALAWMSLSLALTACTAASDHPADVDSDGGDLVDSDGSDVVDSDRDGDTDAVDSDADSDATAFALVGSWVDGYGMRHDITASTWTMAPDTDTPSVFHLLVVDGDARWASAHNDDANTFASGAYSRFDWTWDGDALFFCQTRYDAASQDDAESTTPADPADLGGGCVGFGWSALTPAE